MFFKSKEKKDNYDESIMVLLQQSLLLKKKIIIRMSYGLDNKELKEAVDDFLDEFKKNEYDIFFMNKHSSLLIESIRKHKNYNLKLKLKNFNLKYIDKSNYD